jgi:nucleotide-binding universal stress UspA family protein
MYKKILLATDGSELSLKAAIKLSELEPQWNAEITIFHAWNHQFISATTPFMLSYSLVPYKLNRYPEWDPYETKELLRENGNRYLTDTLQIFIDAGMGSLVSTQLVEDLDPVEFAKEFVIKENIDLVVIGARGQHSKLREVFFGSVCERMVNQVRCDVLVIK